ncbi:Vacuolar inheritance and morphology protein [Lodderomyces elongisporus]|uniref:Vacuolar inheritance and morphology protein n=1 Tax=Lodderomyces elongisporus TaxID=36914 RepID=UPI0029241D9D|nr:Vacuolar inheritance and morphology protein [Lodderomyces elongisporus]WLF80585.1 Vacuolar inheritance and morphology protein [Lodderomyces elongisporus]
MNTSSAHSQSQMESKKNKPEKQKMSEKQSELEKQQREPERAKDMVEQSSHVSQNTVTHTIDNKPKQSTSTSNGVSDLPSADSSDKIDNSRKDLSSLTSSKSEKTKQKVIDNEGASNYSSNGRAPTHVNVPQRSAGTPTAATGTTPTTTTTTTTTTKPELENVNSSSSKGNSGLGLSVAPAKAGGLQILNDENTQSRQEPSARKANVQSVLQASQSGSPAPEIHQTKQSSLVAQPSSLMMNSNGSSLHTPSISNMTDSDARNKNTKHKRIAKQNSTKTDFFAAKLASAVDDVESSDSDETFVYENANDDYDETSSVNRDFLLDTASINGLGVGAVVGSGTSAGIGLSSCSNPYQRSLPLDGENEKRPEKTLNKKTHSVANSLNNPTSSEKDLHKRPLALRTFSSFSANEPEAKTIVYRNLEKIPGEASSSADHKLRASQASVGVAHSITEDENEDAFSYKGSEDGYSIDCDGDREARHPDKKNSAESSEHIRSVDGRNEIHRSSFEASVTNGTGTGTGTGAVSGAVTGVDASSSGAGALQSTASKSNSRKKYQSSTASSKLRSTTSKLFDKKGSQPKRYSIIPDDFDIEDFDDELIYYDNKADTHENDKTPLLNLKQGIPHYRSLNLHAPGIKHQNKRYISGNGQPLISSPDSRAGIVQNNGKRAFPFPHQEIYPRYYYDVDPFDQESQVYESDFDLADSNNTRKKGLRHLDKTDGYTENNGHPFLLTQRPLSSKHGFCKSFLYTFICIFAILTVGFILGFFMATTKELSNVGIVSIENPIVSKDELVFNILVEAFNPGWFSVDIEEVELDLFARSGYLPDSPPALSKNLQARKDSSKLETVKLGSISNLESAMNFKAGFFSREPSTQRGEVKLLNPGKNITSADSTQQFRDDTDNSLKWSIISENPFDLIITGVLKYTLPMGRSTKSVVVRKTGYIDPTLFIM